MAGDSDFTSEGIYSARDVFGRIISIVEREIQALKGFIAKRDVEVVRRSTKGLGTDEAHLINTLCNRTKKQLDAVDLLYHKTYESSLLKVVSNDLSGHFGKMMKYSLMETDAFGTEVFTLATKDMGMDMDTDMPMLPGLGTKDHVLIDLANTNTNAQLAAIKKKWEAKNNKSMLDCLNSELSGNARKILVMLLRGSKSESSHVDHAQAVQQAAALHAAGAQKLIGTDHDVFLDILGRQSRAQIQAIKEAYEKNHGMSLMRAVNKGCSGTYKKCLLACLFPTSEAYTAYALFKAFEGLGTDEDRVTRLLGGTDKKKMTAVSAYYLATYGKSLVEDLKDELSGTFLKAALCWAAGSDPTGGMEYITAELSRDPSEEKHLAKALLQERANVKDFICQADCGDIREACKGLGTSDSRLVSILCGRTKPHLARVDYYYHSLYGMSLEAQIKDECSGVYRDFLVYVVLPPADVDALLLKQAMDGLGTNESAIIDLLAPASNARILAAKKRHDEKYQKPLFDRLKSELSGSLEDVVLALLRAERDEELVNDALAVKQAKELHAAGIAKRFGTDVKTFIRILSKASRPQIQLIRKHYEANHGMSLERAIKKECSGQFETMLLAMIVDPIAYLALQLKKAFQGMMTDNPTVARVLGSNDKLVVGEIGECFQRNYGDSLMEALKKNTSGNFRRAVLTWVCSSDPGHQGHNLAEAFKGLPEDEPCAEDEVVVDRKYKKEDTSAQLPKPHAAAAAATAPPAPPSFYGDGQKKQYPQHQKYLRHQEYTQYGGPPPRYGGPPPPPHHHGGSPPHYGRPLHHHGGPPPPHYGGSAVYYGGPPPAHHEYYQPPPPSAQFYPSAAYQTTSVEALGGKMASGMGPLGKGPLKGQRFSPQAYEDDDDDDDDDEEELDDDYSVPLVGASPQQMIDIRRLARIRTKALMSGNAAKVGRTQDKIKNLKWQIESINT
ncbi:unnamed protein product [Ascophyllum nodosum]